MLFQHMELNFLTHSSNSMVYFHILVKNFINYYKDMLIFMEYQYLLFLL
jgi:hypothetical protein